MTKKLTSLLVALVLALSTPFSLLAQTDSIKRRNVTLQYNLNSLTAIACLFDQPRSIAIKILTSGSSTTVISAAASTDAFALAAVGDKIEFNTQNPTGGVVNTRWITARASANSITVDAAVDISTTAPAGVTYKLYSRRCGASSGWIPVTHNSTINIATAIEQVALGSGALAFRITGYMNDDETHRNTYNLWPGDASAGAECGTGTFASGYCTYTAVGNLPVFSGTNLLQPSFVRVEFYITGADDGVDTGALAEKITIDYTEILAK